MYYEINVAKRINNSDMYNHYFATDERSIRDKDTAKRVLKDFMEKFPEPEYSISISYMPETGEYYPSLKAFLGNEDNQEE